MLRLPSFELETPTTVQEAAALLEKHGDDARPVSAGTDLYPKMKRRQFTPDVLVSLEDIDAMTGIDAGDGLVVGGQESLTTVAEHSVVEERYAALAEAAASVSTPTLRRMGTIAGNLCQDTRCRYYDQTKGWRESQNWCKKAPGPEGYSPDGALGSDAEVDVPCRVVPGSGRCWAVFASDVAPALVALDAEVRIEGADGERVVPLTELYRDDGIAHLTTGRDELLTEVRLPPAAGTESTYLKGSRRGSFDFPELGVAVAVRQDDDGVVEDARIAFTGIASQPVDASDEVEMLVGERPTADLIESAADAAAGSLRPLDNTDLHPANRKQMAAVYGRRGLEAVISD